MSIHIDALRDIAANYADLRAGKAELLTALKDAVCLIDFLRGRDNSCDPSLDISDLREVIAKHSKEQAA